MKIVVLDGYTENPGDLSWDKIRELGETLIFDRTSYEESDTIAERIGDAEIVITNKTPISRMTINKCKNIKFISVLATGYDVVDYEYCAEKGIPVSNVPCYGTDVVGQYAVSLLLEICSHIGHHDATVKSGKWIESKDWCYWDYPLIELAGKKAGIIGLGRIGQTTARILNALGMRIIAFDSHKSQDSAKFVEYVAIDRLMRESDVIFLHCPLTPDTHQIINRKSISLMKDGVIIINNSRGKLIDEKALSDALNTGKIYAAAVDVVSTEPILKDNPLLTAKNCIITPHISWAAKEARERIMKITLENLFGFLQGKPVNVVNR